MLNTITGDIIGSDYEARPIKPTHFRLSHPRRRFVDDMEHDDGKHGGW